MHCSTFIATTLLSACVTTSAAAVESSRDNYLDDNANHNSVSSFASQVLSGINESVVTSSVADSLLSSSHQTQISKTVAESLIDYYSGAQETLIAPATSIVSSTTSTASFGPQNSTQEGILGTPIYSIPKSLTEAVIDHTLVKLHDGTIVSAVTTYPIETIKHTRNHRKRAILTSSGSLNKSNYESTSIYSYSSYPTTTRVSTTEVSAPSVTNFETADVYETGILGTPLYEIPDSLTVATIGGTTFGVNDGSIVYTYGTASTTGGVTSGAANDAVLQSTLLGTPLYQIPDDLTVVTIGSTRFGVSQGSIISTYGPPVAASETGGILEPTATVTSGIVGTPLYSIPTSLTIATIGGTTFGVSQGSIISTYGAAASASKTGGILEPTATITSGVVGTPLYSIPGSLTAATIGGTTFGVDDGSIVSTYGLASKTGILELTATSESGIVGTPLYSIPTSLTLATIGGTTFGMSQGSIVSTYGRPTSGNSATSSGGSTATGTLESVSSTNSTSADPRIIAYPTTLPTLVLGDSSSSSVSRVSSQVSSQNVSTSYPTEAVLANATTEQDFESSVYATMASDSTGMYQVNAISSSVTTSAITSVASSSNASSSSSSSFTPIINPVSTSTYHETSVYVTVTYSSASTGVVQIVDSSMPNELSAELSTQSTSLGSSLRGSVTVTSVYTDVSTSTHMSAPGDSTSVSVRKETTTSTYDGSSLDTVASPLSSTFSGVQNSEVATGIYSSGLSKGSTSATSSVSQSNSGQSVEIVATRTSRTTVTISVGISTVSGSSITEETTNIAESAVSDTDSVSVSRASSESSRATVTVTSSSSSSGASAVTAVSTKTANGNTPVTTVFSSNKIQPDSDDVSEISGSTSTRVETNASRGSGSQSGAAIGTVTSSNNVQSNVPSNAASQESLTSGDDTGANEEPTTYLTIYQGVTKTIVQSNSVHSPSTVASPAVNSITPAVTSTSNSGNSESGNSSDSAVDDETDTASTIVRTVFKTLTASSSTLVTDDLTTTIRSTRVQYVTLSDSDESTASITGTGAASSAVNTKVAYTTVSSSPVNEGQATVQEATGARQYTVTVTASPDPVTITRTVTVPSSVPVITSVISVIEKARTITETLYSTRTGETESAQEVSKSSASSSRSVATSAGSITNVTPPSVSAIVNELQFVNLTNSNASSSVRSSNATTSSTTTSNTTTSTDISGTSSTASVDAVAASYYSNYLKALNNVPTTQVVATRPASATSMSGPGSRYNATTATDK